MYTHQLPKEWLRTNKLRLFGEFVLMKVFLENFPSWIYGLSHDIMKPKIDKEEKNGDNYRA
jgi:hypothetical protein